MTSNWLIIVIATITLFDRGNSLSCICHEESPLTPEQWRAENCPIDVQCPPGSQVIWDVCHCCKSECTKLEGDECGGPFGTAGRCEEGLECHNDESAGSSFLEYDFHGTCIPAKPTPATTKSAPPESTTVQSNAAGGALTRIPTRKMKCGKKKMALMGEEERKECEKARKIKIEKRRERNGKRNSPYKAGN